MHTQRSTFVRRAVLFGGPLGYIVLGLFHPMGDLDVGDATGLYIFLHLVQPVLIALIAYGLWLLVEGLESTAATVVRYALVPYLILYSMFDAVAGVATGLIVQEANGMSAADQAAVQRMMDGIGEHGVLVALWIGSGLSWLVPAVAAALAVRERVPGLGDGGDGARSAGLRLRASDPARPDRDGVVPGRHPLGRAPAARAVGARSGSPSPRLTAE